MYLCFVYFSINAIQPTVELQHHYLKTAHIAASVSVLILLTFTALFASFVYVRWAVQFQDFCSSWEKHRKRNFPRSWIEIPRTDVKFPFLCFRFGGWRCVKKCFGVVPCTGIFFVFSTKFLFCLIFSSLHTRNGTYGAHCRWRQFVYSGSVCGPLCCLCVPQVSSFSYFIPLFSWWSQMALRISCKPHQKTLPMLQNRMEIASSYWFQNRKIFCDDRLRPPNSLNSKLFLNK